MRFGDVGSGVGHVQLVALELCNVKSALFEDALFVGAGFVYCSPMKRILGPGLSLALLACGMNTTKGADASSEAASSSAKAKASAETVPLSASAAARARMSAWKKDGTWSKSADATNGIVDNILKAYAENQVRADATYKGKHAVVLGDISEVRKDDAGDPELVYYAIKSKFQPTPGMSQSEMEEIVKLSSMFVVAHISHSDKASMGIVARVNKDDDCVVACDSCRGYDGIINVDFDDCIVMECKPREKATKP